MRVLERPCVLGQRLEVAGVEGLADHRGDRTARPAAPRAAARSASRPPAGSSPAARRRRSRPPPRSSTRPCRRGRCRRSRRASAPSSLVKKGLPSVASRRAAPRGRRRPSAPPTSDLHERAVLGGGEGRERQRRRTGGRPRKHSSMRVERMAPVRLGLPVAPDDERRGRPQAAHDVLQRLDRDLGAVQVLEDEDERLAAGDARQRPGEQLEDLDPVLGLLLLAGRRDARVAADGRAQVGDLGEHAGRGRSDRPRGPRSPALGRRARRVAGRGSSPG